MNDYNYDCLLFLRKNTRMSIRDKIKIENFKDDLYDSYQKISRIEHTTLVVNYEKAYMREYEIRYRSFLKKVYPLWKRYGDGLDIEEFANKIINDNIISEEEKKLKLSRGR